MNVLLLGFNHRTAPVEVRERYAVVPAALSGLDEKLVRVPGIDEAALISTCNRTEIVAIARDPREVLAPLRSFFQRELGDGSAGAEHLYELENGDAVLHLLRVASSLDSMVLGEAQILGQLKDSYRAAVAARSVGPILNRLFQRAFRAAKRVRSETGLGASPISVARIGVHLARQLFEALERKRVLLLGAGEMAESALSGLIEAGVEEVAILSRTHAAAARLVERFPGRAGSLADLSPELERADVVLCSLQLAQPLLRPEALRGTMGRRQGQPLLIVDLGVPRNVSPEVNGIENVYLYDLDDLEQVALRGRAERRAALAPAQRILLIERDRFESWRGQLPVVPTIRQLLDRAHRVAREEARRLAAQMDGDPADRKEALERMAAGIVAKLLHEPLTRLREEGDSDAAPYYAEAIQRLFGLDVEEDEE
ncbi:MAG: glutamyl-tRNA reductase [Myxococcota bacterium]